MKPVMTKSKNILVLFYVMLFGLISKTQGENESNEGNNDSMYTNDIAYLLQRRNNCVMFGNKPVICIEKIIEKKKPRDDFNEETSGFLSKPKINETSFVDQTPVNKDLINFHDVARSNFKSFSEDYLDVNDLKFYRKVSPSNRDILDLAYKPRILQIVLLNRKRRPTLERPVPKYGRKSFDLGNEKTLTSNESDDESSEETSKETSNGNVDKSNIKGPKPKRFEVIENTDEEEDAVISVDSKEDSSNEEILNIPKKISNKNKEKYLYVQSPTRHLSLNMISDGRRWRLPHFLPKRYHWSEDDIHNLPYLWFNGPQGKYPGIYRKPY